MRPLATPFNEDGLGDAQPLKLINYYPSSINDPFPLI